ncbi:hypothetical protein [Cellulophaga sp. Hel_I_12]|uniref:hypothetical protein n=1 Tax=Cellulophaga sp. Hel_I_12 TaxID=1249972 RepID=UPI000647E401|nr:hypothetical protein [Cellulophaga sp. Hel_I_12]
MEATIKTFIYIHAFFGGLGLITGIGSIICTKGSKAHKRMGKLFSLGMITSSLIAIPIACMPNHENVLLLLIALFTIYLVVSGNQIMTFRSNHKKEATAIDKIISGTMLLLSSLMIVYGSYGLALGNMGSLLFVFFGGFGLSLSIRDFIFYKKFRNTKKGWLANHIGKMVGALIASFTAFIVAGLGQDTLVAWTLPTILGTIYIVYWRRKMNAKMPVKPLS